MKRFSAITRLNICILGRVDERDSSLSFEITFKVVFSIAEIFSAVGVWVRKLVKEETKWPAVTKKHVTSFPESFR